MLDTSFLTSLTDINSSSSRWCPLRSPCVYFAIGTGYYVREGEIPGVDGTEIRGTVEALNRLVEEAGIPDKISLIHQFELSIVTDRQLIEVMENVQVVLSADGFGLAEQKTTKYELLVRDGPIQYGGFKSLRQ